MSDRHDYPFKAEYAKSNRASCKGCRSNIGKDSLRLAIMVQSPMFDGKIPNWHHYACFWKKASVKSHADIHGFDSLRWDDQEKIKEKLSGGAGAPGDDTVPGSTHNDFSTEYAKSNRSTCRGCGDKIEKGVVRIAKIDSEGESMTVYGRPTELWHHVDCFSDNRDDLGFGPEMEPKKILGFGTLSKEDQAELVKKLGKGEKKKRKAEDPKVGGKKAKTEESPEEKELKEQNKLIWTLRDDLYKNVSTDALRGLLEYNEQDIPSGESKLLDRVTDCMIFGALKPCKECKEGQLVYGSSGYRCTGNVTSWTKCMNVTKKPSRKPFKVPAEYNDVECLKKYKYVPRVRAFPPDAVPSSSQPASSSAGGKSQPLEGMSFVIAGKLSKSKTELTKVIQGLGGSVASKVDKTVAACISSTAEVEKMSKHIKDAKKADVHVVNEEFVEAVKKGGAALLIKNHSLATWGGEPLDRIGTAGGGDASRSTYKSGVSKREENRYTKSVPSKMKMMVKGGAAVDPASGLESSAHVLQERGELYTAVLGLVDIAVGTNSYYKLQILESDKSSSYWVFRAWGRVGTTIGGNKLQKCGSKASCIEEFKALYLDKTGNEWENKKDFVKYPNKFYPLEIDYGADDEEIKKLDATAGSNSKLPTEVQDLVKMIFDVESMKKTMLEFEIDMKKMPLGKLSKRQIEQAYSVLNELAKLMEDGGTMTKVMDATNRFYTLIPHDFGLKKPPLLDNVELIKAKTEMLDNLLDIEVAYSLLRSGDGDAADPLDVHYKKLKTDIKILDKKSEEFKRLKKYVKHTHAATHNQYDLEIEEIFKIVREGESKVYRPFRDLHNRQLLWHGSRTTNYAGILSQGLRIAPPEAPVTGYMFGKGIYFADMVSKSANYCRTTKSDPTGLMLLCEVALGDMYERLHAEYVTKLPKGKHSTKGCGMTAPDPAGKYVDEDGMEIPMGKGRDLGLKNSSLLYNEFIVYDVAQVQMKYLLKMNFKFKW